MREMITLYRIWYDYEEPCDPIGSHNFIRDNHNSYKIASCIECGLELQEIFWGNYDAGHGEAGELYIWAVFKRIGKSDFPYTNYPLTCDEYKMEAALE